MNKTALILGASGKIGSHSQRAFAQAGWKVRCFVRGRDNLKTAAQGVQVIVNGLNPPKYHNWSKLIPEITESVIEAAAGAGASVILPGNVYNLDDRGGLWSEDTPHAPVTRKGRIREQMERRYEQSGVQTIVLRAGNFIDPEGNADIMSVLMLRTLAAGKLTTAGSPHVKQAYCYVPDWARAAVRLAEIREKLDLFEDIPFRGHAFSVEDYRQFLQGELGRPLSIETFPWWALKLSAPFWELAREMLEMRYLFNVPHELSGEKMARLLPDFENTPLESVLRAGLHAALPQEPRAAA